jgi:putative cell wall-binding protein
MGSHTADVPERRRITYRSRRNAMPISRSTSICLALATFFATFALAGLAAATVTDPGALSGTVRDWSTKEPVPNVEIRLHWMDDTTFVVDSVPTTTTVTDATGAWSFAGLPNDLYVIAHAETTSAYRDVTFPGRGWDVLDSVGFRPDDFEGPLDEYMLALPDFKKYRFYRVNGVDRYRTAIEISKANFFTAQTVVLASGQGFADALAAAPLAGLYDAPILLTTRTKLPSGLITEIRRLQGTPPGPMKVLVVGGTAVVGNEVITALKNAGITNVSRIAGSDRYDTAGRIALKVHAERDGAIWPFITRGDVFADALSVSAFAYMERRPILLTRPAGTPGPSKSAWQGMHDDVDDTAITVGGPASINNTSLYGFAEVSGFDPSGQSSFSYLPIEGQDRYDTCENLISFYLDDFWGEKGFDVMGLASGETFPDALTGGAARGAIWGPLVLTQRSKLSGPARSTIARSGPYVVDFQAYGGPVALAEGTVNAAKTALGTQVYDIDAAGNRIPLPQASVQSVFRPADATMRAAEPGTVGAFRLEASGIARSELAPPGLRLETVAK